VEGGISQNPSTNDPHHSEALVSRPTAPRTNTAGISSAAEGSGNLSNIDSLPQETNKGDVPWSQAQMGYYQFDSFDPDLLNALSYTENQYAISDGWAYGEQSEGDT